MMDSNEAPIYRIYHVAVSERRPKTSRANQKSCHCPRTLTRRYHKIDFAEAGPCEAGPCNAIHACMGNKNLEKKNMSKILQLPISIWPFESQPFSYKECEPMTHDTVQPIIFQTQNADKNRSLEALGSQNGVSAPGENVQGRWWCWGIRRNKTKNSIFAEWTLPVPCPAPVAPNEISPGWLLSIQEKKTPTPDHCKYVKFWTWLSEKESSKLTHDAMTMVLIESHSLPKMFLPTKKLSNNLHAKVLPTIYNDQGCALMWGDGP